MQYKMAGLIAFLVFMTCTPLQAGEKTITLLHSNDLHSHLMPHGPELDYVPQQTGVDETIGGWARIATVLQNEREKRENPVFTVDSGDYTMGTLFHTLAREKSFELRLMHEMGYDFVTLGNHEFDMFPEGLARMINTAEKKGQLPEIVFSSAVFAEDCEEDEALEAVFERGLVEPYSIVQVDGLQVGFYGIMGQRAAEDAPFASPVTFKDPVQISREMVDKLKGEKNVDIVVCLSHSGLYMDSVSEDKDIAEAVSGIDVLVSGHSHTLLEKPLTVNDTLIVQAGEYGEAVGALDIVFDGQDVYLEDYELIRIDDQVPADEHIQSRIDSFIHEINMQFLRQHDLNYWQKVLSTDFDLTLQAAESNLGNFLADAVRWYVNQYVHDPEDPASRVRMAVKANGVIRADILQGETGQQTVADMFRTLPLGVGLDREHSPGYPLADCYVYGYEIKRILEIITTIYPMRDSAFFLQLSGVKFTYNPYRAPFDRVTEIYMENEQGQYEPLDYSRSNEQLYRIAANIFEAGFIQVIGSYTWDILDIVPKDQHGEPVQDLQELRVDAQPGEEGVQELKEWLAVLEYVSSFEDKSGDGLPDMPEKYKHLQGRIVQESSLNPVDLLAGGNVVTWGALVLILAAAALLMGLVYLGVKKLR